MCIRLFLAVNNFSELAVGIRTFLMYIFFSISGQIFRTFYAYDAVNINQSLVVNNTVIILRPKKSEFVYKTTNITVREILIPKKSLIISFEQ